MTDLIFDAARRYVAAGLSVIPIVRGDKAPAHFALEAATGQAINWIASDSRAAWRAYCARLPTEAELAIWFADGGADIGIVGGRISGGLVRIDFEHPACIAVWRDLLREQDWSLAMIATAVAIVQTGKGHHVYFRMPEPPGHEILCSSGAGSTLMVLSETQGEGCYCLAPPSAVPGSYVVFDEAARDRFRPHYTQHYAWTSGDETTIPTFDQATATALIDAARFVGLWEQALRTEDHEVAIALHRAGLIINDRSRFGLASVCLDWAQIRALRTYLERYEALLQAVETAPPPPPSYREDEEEDEDV